MIDNDPRPEFPLAFACARRRWAWLPTADLRQTVSLAICTDASTRNVQRECYRLSRDLAKERKRYQTHTFNKCSIIGCANSHAYNDPDYGKLCRKHGMLVRQRRRRGSAIDSDIKLFPPVPVHNNEMWTAVRELLTNKEWLTIWTWARSRHEQRPKDIFNKIREGILNAIDRTDLHEVPESFPVLDADLQSSGAELAPF